MGKYRIGRYTRRPPQPVFSNISCRRIGDQTESTPQRWAIVAPRIRLQAPLDLDRNGSWDPWVGFLRRSTWNAWSLLAVTSEKGAIQSAFEYQQRGKLSHLEVLPAELICMIIAELESEKDVISFGLTSRSLWQHFLGHVLRNQTMGPMAGVEIACIGTQLRALPEPFLCDDLYLNSVDLSITNNSHLMILPRRINYRAAEEYAHHKSPYAFWHFWIDAFDRSGSGISEHLFNELKKDLFRCLAGVGRHVEDSHWVFRNHTTKEYIRCKVRATPQGMQCYVPDKKSPPIEIEDIALLRLSWTRKQYNFTRTENKLVNGVWAGHCFDIVPFDQDDPDFDVDGWSDITRTMVRVAKWTRKRIHSRNRVELYMHMKKVKRKAGLRKAQRLRRLKLRDWQ